MHKFQNSATIFKLVSFNIAKSTRPRCELCLVSNPSKKISICCPSWTNNVLCDMYTETCFTIFEVKHRNSLHRIGIYNSDTGCEFIISSSRIAAKLVPGRFQVVFIICLAVYSLPDIIKLLAAECIMIFF